MKSKPKPKLRTDGVMDMLDEKSGFQIGSFQVVELLGCYENIVRCQISDGKVKLGILLMLNSTAHQEPILDFDIIVIKKSDVKKVSFKDQVFVEITNFSLYQHHDEQIGNPKYVEEQIKRIQNQDLQDMGGVPESSHESLIYPDSILTILDLRAADIEQLRLSKNLKTSGRIVYKSEIMQVTHNPKKRWMYCKLVDPDKNQIDLIFYDRLDHFHNQICVNQMYQISNFTVIKDKYSNISKIKIVESSNFTLLKQDTKNMSPIEPQPTIYDLSLIPRIQDKDCILLQKIAYVVLVEMATMDEQKPTIVYLYDRFDTLRRFCIWKDHKKAKVPDLLQYVLLQNIVWKDDKREFHSTKKTQILNQQQALKHLGVQLPKPSERIYIFVRRDHRSFMQMSFLKEVGKLSSLYVVALIMFNPVDSLHIEQRCSTCEQIMPIIDHQKHCSFLDVEYFYDVKCQITDDTATVELTIKSELVQRMVGMTPAFAKESQVRLQLAKKRLGKFIFNRQLLKIEVEEWKGVKFAGVVDVFRRIASEETKLYTDLTKPKLE